MSPVRAPSTAKVGDIDRRFIDDLTRASVRGSSAPGTEGASAHEVAGATAHSPIGRAAIGVRQSNPVPGDPSRTAALATASDVARKAITADEGIGASPVAGRRAALELSTTPSPDDVAEDGTIISTGTLSDDPHTAGMYVPPDFYHGNSYSPVFDRQDENGNWVPTPRFEGQKIYSKWRGSLPPDFDPNARVIHDPLLDKQGPRWWKQDENGDWVRRPESPEGLALLDDGSTINTLDPAKYPDKS